MHRFLKEMAVFSCVFLLACLDSVNQANPSDSFTGRWGVKKDITKSRNKKGGQEKL